MATATTAKLFQLDPVRRVFLVLGRYVIALFALGALQNYVISWHKLYLFYFVWSSRQSVNSKTYYSTISDTVPAPTVLPPSRIAKRSPFSIAIGAISSISIWMLSPGITISTPDGKCATPVTSVVLK